MKRYQAIIFDFDMTLADSAQVIVKMLNQTAKHFGYPARAAQEVLPIVGNTHEKMLSFTTGVTDPMRLLEMRAYYRAVCREDMPRLTAFFPDAAALLEAISRAGMQMAVVSLKLRDILLACLEKEGLSRYFQAVLGCEDVPAPKPDPSGLVLAANQLGISPDRCLYTGDSLVDQQAAAGAGMDFAAMLKGATRREQFDPRMVRWYFDSPAHMAQAVTQGFRPL